MKLISLTLAAALLGPVSAHAFDLTAMTDAEREAFRAEVKAYLLEHPELLIDVSNALQQKQAAEQAKGDQALIAANAN